MKKKLKLLASSLLVALTFSMPQKAHGMDNSHDDIVEKVYNHNSIYRPDIFDHHSDGIVLSTPACRPKKERNQSVLIYPKKSEDFIPENILMKAIPGRDGRERIPSTTVWPNSIHTQLSMTFKGDTYGGSGVMVGPHHLLTCGHCVYHFDKKILFEEILAYPALNGEEAPFGKVKVTKAYMFKNWQDRGDPRFDMALLLLDQSIGDYVGWGGLLNASDEELSQEKVVHITGYPGDKGFKQMWSMGHKIKTVKPEQFDYEHDTYGGQSGSAVWVKKLGMPMVLGVHSLGGDENNSGVRLSEQKFKRLLLNKISQTYVLGLNAVPIPLSLPLQPEMYNWILTGPKNDRTILYNNGNHLHFKGRNCDLDYVHKAVAKQNGRYVDTSDELKGKVLNISAQLKVSRPNHCQFLLYASPYNGKKEDFRRVFHTFGPNDFQSMTVENFLIPQDAQQFRIRFALLPNNQGDFDVEIKNPRITIGTTSVIERDITFLSIKDSI